MMTVDDGLLTYSLRERCWAWDIDEIQTEKYVMPNVLDLLSTKIAHLSESSQVGNLFFFLVQEPPTVSMLTYGVLVFVVLGRT
jgi:hypothetical protein